MTGDGPIEQSLRPLPKMGNSFEDLIAPLLF
jgi:hypothetical protein